MKVKLLRDCEGPNPEFDADEKRAVEQLGEIYTIPHTITIPAGTVIDHPQAHLLCRNGYMNAAAQAEPVDEPAKARYQQWLESMARGLRELQLRLRRPPTKPEARRHLQRLAKAYGVTAHGSLPTIDEVLARAQALEEPPPDPPPNPSKTKPKRKAA